MSRFLLPLLLVALGAACARQAPGTPPAATSGAAVRLPDVAAEPADTVLVARAETLAAPPVEPPRVPSDSVTARTYRQILADARTAGVAERPYGEIVQWVGEQLVGRPYVAGLLDAPAEETLVVDLTQFDCVLFIENVLAVARQIALGRTDYDGYASFVSDLRYRDGHMDGYCSRLHYFSDWIADNARRGHLENVTAAAGGEPFDKRITFMSEHRASYPRLASDSVFACIVGTEAQLQGAQLVYIPKSRVAEAYPHMQAGDIVATATSIAGLDVTHTGFVHRAPDGGTGFLHASSASNAVKVSPDLAEYIGGVRSQVGVILVRPVDPRPTSGRPAPRG